MLRQTLALTLAASLIGTPLIHAQPATGDAELQRGIRQVEDGDYDPAIVTLDAAARRLAGDPVQLNIGCQLEPPPYTACGTSNRTSDTTAGLSGIVTPTTYLILVSNYSGRTGTEVFTLTVLYP